MISASFYTRYRDFYAKWGSLITLVQGAIVVAISIVLLVIALAVQAQANEHTRERAKEHATLRVACERSKRFGPPLIQFFIETQGRLGIAPISEAELAYYRSTIPKSCPTK